jgi:hypothetical protein
MVSFSLRLRISYLLLQDSSLVSFHLIQFAIHGCAKLFLTILEIMNFSLPTKL